MMKWILCLIAVAISLATLKWLPNPYVWVGLLWIGIFSVFFIKEKSTTSKAIWFNMAIISLFLTGAEVYFWHPFSEQVKNEGEYFSHKTFVKSEHLGYQPPKNAKNILGRVTKGKRLIYEMVYSTDEHSQRIGYKNPNAQAAAVFFGCSFTFGIGIKDNQTLPYLTGKLADQKINTYNFAYGGYGAQQMLSALEHNLDKEILTEKPRVAIYTALPEHIIRTAGLTSWSFNDPKYEINDRGMIYLAGHFNDKSPMKSIWKNRFQNYLNKSYTIQKIMPYFTRQQKLSYEEHLERYIKVVIAAKEIFTQRYPGSTFHIILWPFYEKAQEALMAQMIDAFKAQGIFVHQVETILPNFSLNNPLYQIEGDGHPTPKANEQIAHYIVDKILQG